MKETGRKVKTGSEPSRPILQTIILGAVAKGDEYTVTERCENPGTCTLYRTCCTVGAIVKLERVNGNGQVIFKFIQSKFLEICAKIKAVKKIRAKKRR